MRRLPPVNSDNILAALIPGAVVVAIVAVIVVQNKKTKANLAALAQQLGFSVETTGRFIKKTRLVGQLRGKAMEIFGYTTGSGKTQKHWASIAVQVTKTGGLTFSLEQRVAFFDAIARLFRKNEAKVGDATFDERWVLKTNQPEFMQAALLPELREKLMRFSGSGISSPSFKLAGSRVQYSELGSFSSEKMCRRLAECTGLLCELADIVEVGAEMQRPQS